MCGGPAVLAAIRKGVLIPSANSKLFRYVFACLGHGIRAEHFLHERVNEAPTNGRIENFRVSADVAVVFAGLISAAINHVIDGGPVNFRVAFHEGADWEGGQVFGAQSSQCSAVAAEWGAESIANEGIFHGEMVLILGTLFSGQGKGAIYALLFA